MSVLRAEGVGTCTVAGPEMWASVHRLDRDEPMRRARLANSARLCLRCPIFAACDALARTDEGRKIAVEEVLAGRIPPDPRPLPRPLPGPGVCSVPGCGRRHERRGYCPAHLKRVQKYGEPLTNRPIMVHRIPIDDVERAAADGVPMDDVLTGMGVSARSVVRAFRRADRTPPAEYVDRMRADRREATR